MEAVRSELEQNGTARDSVQFLRDNQIEALKSLAMLLMREVESLRKAPANVDEALNHQKANLLERTQQYEKDLIRAALIKTNGSQVKAARLLGTKVTTLNVKIKRYGIDLANQSQTSLPNSAM